MSDTEIRALERAALAGDHRASRALAINRFRAVGDCGADIKTPWSRRCGNKSQVVVDTVRPVRTLPSCPSCLLKQLRCEALRLALTPDQRNFVRGFKGWSSDMIRRSRVRIGFLRAVFLRQLGYLWDTRYGPIPHPLLGWSRPMIGRLVFLPGQPPEDALAEAVDGSEGIYAYWRPSAPESPQA